ncbi:MAG: glycosyltransferase [Thermoprotei archaeon]
MYKRIYIAPCGIGLGHVRRMEALAGALKNFGIGNVVFSTYGVGYQYLHKLHYDYCVYKSPEIDLIFNEDGYFDFHNTVMRYGIVSLYRFIKQIGYEIGRLNFFKPSVVISDSRLSTTLAGWILGIPTITVLNQLNISIPRVRPMRSTTRLLKKISERFTFEVFSFLWARSKKIVVADFPPPYTISRMNIMVHQKYKNRFKLIGPLLPLDLRELPSKDRVKEMLGLKSPVIVAVFSGNKIERNIAHAKLLPYMMKLAKTGYTVIEIGGLNNFIPSLNNFYSYPFVEDVYMYMRAADVAISTGGQTTLAELMKIGVPTIALPPIGHTEKTENSTIIKKLGLGIVVPLQKVSNNLENLVKEVLYNESYRNQAIKVSEEVNKYKGITTLSKMVLDLMED